MASLIDKRNPLMDIVNSIARGAPQAATGFVDLAALPFTLSGLLDPKNVVGSTEYLTQRGLLPRPSQSLLGQSVEAISGGLMPLSPSAMRATQAGIEATGKALAPKAGMALENYMAQQGLLQNIVPISTARDIKMPVTLPTDDVFKKAVENTPGASITDEGLVMNVMRKQKPQQAETESVRGGVFYLPEGSTSMKHYGGTTGYGGTEKISGETLYKNPLFVKGATGGKAPEVAYDQLVGKGAYQEMRNDALRVRHPELISDKRYNLADAITPEEFLSKYAPDLEGYGDYIFYNSREGNQLAYALQEAAVAQKARDAGYDAVLGYSKKRTGDPVLSEVFDVREAIYPSTSGDYRLMDKFEGLLD